MRASLALLLFSTSVASAALPPTAIQLRDFRQRLAFAAQENGDPRLGRALTAIEDAGFLAAVLRIAGEVSSTPGAIDRGKVLRVATEWVTATYPRDPDIRVRPGPFVGMDLRAAAVAVIDGRASRGFVEARVRLRYAVLGGSPGVWSSRDAWILIRTEDWTVAQHELVAPAMPDDAAPPWR